jgi:hypothetical protein
VIEVVADLWSPIWDLRCITTNGYVKKNGCAVMGRGVAAQAKKRYPWLPEVVGHIVQQKGNHVCLIIRLGDLVTFPVKYNWWEKADLALIERSAHELEELVDIIGATKVALPRPGCGNGKLEWEAVKPILEFLDNRFYVITYGKKM